METPHDFRYQHENAWQSARRHLREDTGRSFDTAWEQMRHKGNPKPFAFKLLGVGVGSVLIGDGIYNVVKGFNEEVEDALLSDRIHRNYVRIGTGAMEMAGGAALLYAGLTKTGLGR